VWLREAEDPGKPRLRAAKRAALGWIAADPGGLETPDSFSVAGVCGQSMAACFSAVDCGGGRVWTSPAVGSAADGRASRRFAAVLGPTTAVDPEQAACVRNRIAAWSWQTEGGRPSG